MALHDYRLDPFTEADQAISVDMEGLTIPSASPFYVQLEEVPRLNDPSTVVVYNVTDALTMQEVSAEPASQEYQVDYPTPLGENPSSARYGTGKIRFNSAQGTKTVQVTYKGTGHLVKASRAVPTGAGMEWYNNVLPEGFLWQDGASYLRANYPALFAELGTVWGSVDGDHFNVPNKKGRVSIGAGQGSTYANGVDVAGTNFTLAAIGGMEKHKLTIAELAAHTHAYPAYNAAGSARVITQGSITNDTNSTSTGGDTAHNNMQAYIVVNWIIKT